MNYSKAIENMWTEDEHLNVFWPYGEVSHLENNITKALINTFISLPFEEQNLFLTKINSKPIPDGCTSFEVYLQRKPDAQIIKNIEADNRRLIAFSPTGCGRDYEGQEVFDPDDKVSKKKFMDNVRRAIKDKNPQFSDKDVEKCVNEEVCKIIEIQEDRGGSIPDAWILGYNDDRKPLLCVAFENKLYDLDQNQLKNHMEKSLYLNGSEEKESNCTYHTYSEILEAIYHEGEYLSEEFARYMFLLGYAKIENLSELCSAGEILKTKYAKEKCWEILECIQKKYKGTEDTVQRNSETTTNAFKKSKLHKGVIIDDRYLKEIDLDYNDNQFVLGLYFATAQTRGKDFYFNCSTEEKSLEELKADEYKLCFHFQVTGIARALREPKEYMKPADYAKLAKYISFWKSNLDKIMQTSASDRRTILELMKNEDFFTQEGYKIIEESSDNYRSQVKKSDKLYLAPEFGIIFKWSFCEAVELEKTIGFEKKIIDSINQTYRCFFPEKELIRERT